MTIATQADIRTKVRRLTVSGSSYQLTDSMIDDYVASFYLYDLPAEFRSLKLKDSYVFDTIKGIDVYPFDYEHWTTVESPARCSKKEMSFFKDTWAFATHNFSVQNVETLATGSGITLYTGITNSNPIIRSVNNAVGSRMARVQNVLITANVALGSTLNVTDDGAGNLVGDCTAGTINYDTGAVSVNFSGAVPVGEAITIQYNPAVLGRPLSILFYQDQFTLRPVPDMGYTIELVAYRQPMQALATSPSAPGFAELNEWWELLAFGAAKKIYEDRLDPDGIMLMDRSLQERYAIAEARTYAQLSTSRINTIYSEQLNYNYGSSTWFGGTSL